MLSQLNSWSQNTYPMALTVYNRPHDNSDTICIRAYRVLLDVYGTPKIRNSYTCPDPQSVLEKVNIIYEKLRDNPTLDEQDITNYREIVDIIYSHFRNRAVNYIVDEYTFVRGRTIRIPPVREIRRVEGVAAPVREIRRVEGVAAPNKPKFKNNVYQDTQNVHDSNINQSVLKAAKHLTDTFAPTSTETVRDEMTKANKRCSPWKLKSAKERVTNNIVDSCIDSIERNTALFGEISLTDVLGSLWTFIEQHEFKEDLKERLLEEFHQMNGYCSTGYLARLINVIQGYTEDENLLVTISNEKRTEAVITSFINRALQESKDENVIDGMLDKNSAYLKFIDDLFNSKVEEWIKELEVDKENIKTVIDKKYLL